MLCKILHRNMVTIEIVNDYDNSVVVSLNPSLLTSNVCMAYVMLRDENKVKAIKFLRHVLGLPLMEGKYLHDYLETMCVTTYDLERWRDYLING